MKITSTSGMKEDYELNQIQVYPNPTEGEIQVNFKNDVVGSNFIFMDQIGKEVLKGRVSNEMMTINLDKLTQGVYFLSLENNSQTRVKIVKK